MSDMSDKYLKLNYFKKMTMKMVNLWHPPKKKKKDAVTS